VEEQEEALAVALEVVEAQVEHLPAVEALAENLHLFRVATVQRFLGKAVGVLNSERI
jgi:hypothetical protein